MQLNSRQIILSKRPVGLPNGSSFTFEKVSLPNELKDNELLLHGLFSGKNTGKMIVKADA